MLDIQTINPVDARKINVTATSLWARDQTANNLQQWLRSILGYIPRFLSRFFLDRQMFENLKKGFIWFEDVLWSWEILDVSMFIHNFREMGDLWKTQRDWEVWREVLHDFRNNFTIILFMELIINLLNKRIAATSVIFTLDYVLIFLIFQLFLIPSWNIFIVSQLRILHHHSI